MTEQIRSDFERTGVLRLKNYLSIQSVQPVKIKILNELKRLKFMEGGKFHTSKFKSIPIFQQTNQLGQLIRDLDEVNSLFPHELLQFMNDLADSGLKAAHPFPQILLSFPHKQDWSLKNLNWHVDYKPGKKDVLLGIQAFVLIDEVKPRGGATLALSGSHKLNYVKTGFSSTEVLRKSNFDEHPELFLETQNVHGNEIKIVEMCGGAGDVYLMDLRVLHTPSVNSTQNLRMMTTNRFLVPTIGKNLR